MKTKNKLFNETVTYFQADLGLMTDCDGELTNNGIIREFTAKTLKELKEKLARELDLSLFEPGDSEEFLEHICEEEDLDSKKKYHAMYTLMVNKVKETVVPCNLLLKGVKK